METFKFIINSPKGRVFKKDVVSVNFESEIGFLTIFSNHSNVTGVINKTGIKIEDKIIGFAKNGVYRFYNNSLEFVVAHFEKDELLLSENLINTKNELKLSNIKKNVAADLLLEIELLKHLKKSK